MTAMGDVSHTVHHRTLQGCVIALVIGRRYDGDLILSAGIRWRVCDDRRALLVRSIDGGTTSTLTRRAFTDLLERRRIAVCADDPYPSPCSSSSTAAVRHSGGLKPFAK